MPSQELFDRCYTERMIVVRLLVAQAYKLGYQYGIGIDNIEETDPERRRVVYIDLPEGQYSWHIAPHDWDLFSDLPEYEGEWDGTCLGKSKEHALQIEVS